MLNVDTTVFYSNHGGTNGNDENNVGKGSLKLIMAMIIKNFYDSKKEFMIMTHKILKDYVLNCFVLTQQLITRYQVIWITLYITVTKMVYQ